MGIKTGITPSLHMKLYESNIVISLDHKNNISILKDRYSGINKNLSTAEVIEILSRILSLYMFKGRMGIFQEAMKIRLVEKINDIISNNDIVPKGDFDNANPIQRKSNRNGFEDNKPG